MSPEPISLFARTIRGIEWIGAAEIEQRCGATITEIRHREIRFQIDSLNPELLAPGSIDDVFLTCGILNDVDHTRAALAVLAKRSSRIAFTEKIAPLKQLRGLADKPNFDVVASFLGRRNYNRFEIEDTVAEVITHQTGWTYTPQREQKADRLDLSFRVHLSGQEAIVGARLTIAPLHRRSYKIESRTGTLHPPLAFAMAMLANLDGNQQLLDPFCGVGTILIEATTLEPGLCASGVDIDRDSIRKAMSIAEIANRDISFIVGDAGQLPFAAGEIDRVISNPPWGRAVDVRGSARGSFFAELARVSGAGARIVLLTDDADEAIEHSGFKLLLRTPVSLFGSWPELLVFSNSTGSLSLASALERYWIQWPGLLEKTSHQS